MHGCLFLDLHFIGDDPPKYNNIGTKTIKVCLMNPGIYLLFHYKFLRFLISLVSILSYSTETSYTYS